MTKPYISDFIFEQWHGWNSTTCFFLSNQDTTQLYSFRDIDDAVNWLWFNDFKTAAKALNLRKHRENEK